MKQNVSPNNFCSPSTITTLLCSETIVRPLLKVKFCEIMGNSFFKSNECIPQNMILYLFQHLEQALLLGTRGAFIHECKELGLTTGNNNGKRRSSVSSASGVFDKLKVNVFQAFDDVDMESFFEVCFFLRLS